MIERTWKGIANAEMADQYIEHLATDVFPKIRGIPGNIGAKVLKRPLNGQVEFLVVTSWVSMQAIQAFAGENIDIAVVPDQAQACLFSFDGVVEHYEWLDI